MKKIILIACLTLFLPFVVGAQAYDEQKYSHDVYDTQGRMIYDFDHYKGDFATWQSELRSELKQKIGLNRIEEALKSYKPKADFKESLDFDTYVMERWILWTEPELPLPVVVLKPKNLKGRAPLVVTMQGHNKNPETYAFIYEDEHEREHILEGDRHISVQAVNEGYVVVLPTTRAFGQLMTEADKFKPELVSSCEEMSRRDRLVGRTLIGDRVWDISKVIDWSLENLPVDGTNIIMTGNSGGGTATIYAGAIDTRISLSMPGAAFCPFVESIGSIFHCECNYIPGILDLGEMQDIAGLTAPRLFHAINGNQDPIFPIEATRKAMSELKRIYAAAGAEQACSLYEGEGGHRFYKDGAWPFVKEHLLPVRPANVVVADEAPFHFEPLVMHEFPNKEYDIRKYGAKRNNVEATTRAIKRAMEACSKTGGKVVIPGGDWICGPIAFKSNCNLFLSEGAKLAFTDDLKYYPVVRTTWEAMEVMNYSPLIYAYDCENVAISGPGTLYAKMDFWYGWYDRPDSHLAASKDIAIKACTGVPYDQRRADAPGANMRPCFVEFNRCKNVQFADFHLQNSPMWCLHLFMCKDVWVHDVDIVAEGHNSDGIDIDMTQHAVVERCRFYQNDDAVCFKAGRNKDGWDLATPTRDVVVRNCHIECGGSFMAAGSELSSGISNVYVHHCTGNNMINILRVKTNERRGGEVCDIVVEDCFAKIVRAVVSIDTDVMFQYRTLVPTFEVRKTKIHDIAVKNVGADWAETVCEIFGDKDEPVRNVSLKNVHVGEVSKVISNTSNVVDLQMDNVKINNYSKSGESRKDWGDTWHKYIPSVLNEKPNTK